MRRHQRYDVTEAKPGDKIHLALNATARAVYTNAAFVFAPRSLPPGIVSTSPEAVRTIRSRRGKEIAPGLPRVRARLMRLNAAPCLTGSGKQTAEVREGG